MTDEEIKQIAEKTKKEKYCCKFRTGELECGDCPITYEGYPCSEDYVLPFIDGFKACEKINEEQEWPSDADLRKIHDTYNVNEIACKEAEKELLNIADRQLTIQQKAVWLSDVLNRFFIKGYNYAKYEEKH